jgi:hypothetical protein
MQSTRLAATLLLSASLSCTVHAAQGLLAPPGRALQLDLAAQPLADSLNQLAEAARLQIVFYSEAARGVQAPQLVGSFDVATALDRLLANTPLEYEFVDTNTVVVRERASGGQSNAHSPNTIFDEKTNALEKGGRLHGTHRRAN